MKELTPYIIFGIGQLIGFVIWIVRLQSKIEKMETEIEHMKESQKKHEERHSWLSEQLQKANEALAVAKSVLEGLVLKEMKTRRA